MIDDTDNTKDILKDDSRVAVAAIHEAGHAVAYAKMFAVAPISMTVSYVNPGIGEILTHDITQSKEMVLKEILMLMAGKAAEEVILGKYDVIGSSEDVQQAEENLVEYFRKKRITAKKRVVQKVLAKQFEAAKRELRKYKNLLQKVAKYLLNNESMTPEKFSRICEKYSVEAAVVPPDRVLGRPGLKTRG